MQGSFSNKTNGIQFYRDCQLLLQFVHLKRPRFLADMCEWDAYGGGGGGVDGGFVYVYIAVITKLDDERC